MRNGPILWNEVLRVARDLGDRPIIAGGAIRDYVILRSDPKDIDVFIQGEPPEDTNILDGWEYRDRGMDRFAEYNGGVGIMGIREYDFDRSPCPIQLIWVDGDPVQYVKGFDLGTSQCYYRGAMVLGKNFLDDWHHQQITILPQAFRRPGGIDRSRERAQALSRKYPNGAAIVEIMPPEGIEAVRADEINNIILREGAQPPVPLNEWWDRNILQNGVNNGIRVQAGPGDALAVDIEANDHPANIPPAPQDGIPPPAPQLQEWAVLNGRMVQLEPGQVVFRNGAFVDHRVNIVAEEARQLNAMAAEPAPQGPDNAAAVRDDGPFDVDAWLDRAMNGFNP